MRDGFVNLLVRVLSRRGAWRLGRSLYLKARADSPNDARLNGEERVQRELVDRFAAAQERLVVLDVGANVGDWTWSLLEEGSRRQVGDRLEVHSFEPVPSTTTVLAERVEKHPLSGLVKVVSRALSDEEGSTEMYVSGETAGTNSLHPDAMSRGKQLIRIDRTTADRYCSENGIETIHYLKCDTEGHDMRVLLGARGLFDERRVMAFQFEYNHRWVYSRHYLKDVFDLLGDTDYGIGKITPDGIEIYDEWHPELERFFEGNYVILHPDAVGWFKTIRGEYDACNTYAVRPA